MPPPQPAEVLLKTWLEVSVSVPEFISPPPLASLPPVNSTWSTDAAAPGITASKRAFQAGPPLMMAQAPALRQLPLLLLRAVVVDNTNWPPRTGVVLVSR